MRVLVVGSGIFGCCVALELAKSKHKVTLIDKQAEIMSQASKINHNRLHLGYHYLRSIDTAEQSLDGMMSFLFNFGNAVVYQFPNYYAIASENSKTTPDQFIDFCETVRIGYSEEYPQNKFLNRNKIASCFRVPEPVFDYGEMRKIILDLLYSYSKNLELRLKTECGSLAKIGPGLYEAGLNGYIEEYDVIVNATYADFNKLNSEVGALPKEIMFEDVVIPEFQYSHDKIGLTIMDGPFCSVMPKGKTNHRFLLYHVEHSVCASELRISKPDFNTDVDIAIDKIFEHSKEFMPFLENSQYFGYGRTTRAVFENSDDARLTELYTYDGLENYFAILSGKISTCVQVALQIKHILLGKTKIKPLIV